jgi:hypothetical protein
VIRRSFLSILLVVILLTVVGAVSAQDQPSDGTIRGTVYQDLNANGSCATDNEPVLAGVTIEFASDRGETVALASGTDGKYELVTVASGTWNVTAKPGQGRSVTSTNPHVVVITLDQPVTEGADFCVTAVGTTSGGAAAVVLPESGSPVSPLLLAAIVAGGLLVLAGLGLEVQRRRSTG